MATIHLETVVKQNFQQVKQKFNKDLFKALKPPLINLKIHRYDGEQVGDQLSLEIAMGPFSQKWEGIITENHSEDFQWYFVDEGKKLPFPLKSWKHQHKLIDMQDGNTKIIDHVQFQTKTPLEMPFVYSQMLVMFLMRKPQYKRYFENKK